MLTCTIPLHYFLFTITMMHFFHTIIFPTPGCSHFHCYFWVELHLGVSLVCNRITTSQLGVNQPVLISVFDPVRLPLMATVIISDVIATDGSDGNRNSNLIRIAIRQDVPVHLIIVCLRTP